MSTITLEDAQVKLAESIHGLARGEGVTIMENDWPGPWRGWWRAPQTRRLSRCLAAAVGC
jgi:hypothetical protein